MLLLLGKAYVIDVLGIKTARSSLSSLLAQRCLLISKIQALFVFSVPHLSKLRYLLSASPNSISNPLNSSSDLSTFQTSANIMALIEALNTANVVYSYVFFFFGGGGEIDYCSLMESSVHTILTTPVVTATWSGMTDKGIYTP